MYVYAMVRQCSSSEYHEIAKQIDRCLGLWKLQLLSMGNPTNVLTTK